MEFEIRTDLSVLPAIIESNAPEIRAELDKQLEFYRNMVITPETIKDGKDAKASLNKLKTAISDKRKEVKKQCLDPYTAFENACKEIEKMIDEAVESIDSQLREFARQVATEKLEALQKYFATLGVDWIDLGRILNPKWKNSGMKLKALEQEIVETVSRMTAEAKELETIYGNTPLFPAIWGKYLETYDKGQTFAYAAVLIQQEQQRPTPAPMPEPVPAPAPTPQTQEQIGSCAFRVTGTQTQIKMLRDFMNHNKIRFEILR